MSSKDNSLAKYIDNLSVHTKDMLVAETDDEFDRAFENWLVIAISRLESSNKELKDLGEDALSSILAMALSTGEVSVTRETHSNGHVDLTVKLVNSAANRTKLGEAKIWDGPSYHTKGLGQLLNRYTTGRECRGFVISYVKLQDIKALFNKLRQHIDSAKPYDLQGICKDHNIRWSFLSSHKHSSGEIVEVCHVGCNMHFS
jgi:hypothetical protein